MDELAEKIQRKAEMQQMYLYMKEKELKDFMARPIPVDDGSILFALKDLKKAYDYPGYSEEGDYNSQTRKRVDELTKVFLRFMRDNLSKQKYSKDDIEDMCDVIDDIEYT